MIGYATLGTNDPARANAFYDAVMGSVGVGRLMEFPTGAVCWGASGAAPMVAVGKPWDGGAATPGNGTMLALVVDSRARVDALHAAAMAAGGSDEGAPGVRGDEGAPGVRGDDGPRAFYGAYFRDLDGNKLCAFRMGPA
jgi:catechol 2,3-dioxygenase-like lactoylglutathione lyase family enzyme